MPSPATPALPEIRLAGFLQSGLGLGESGRIIARSLTDAGVPLATHAWKKSDIEQVGFEENPVSRPADPGVEAPPGISLLSLNGDQLGSFLRGEGKGFLGNNYVIGIWFWELEELPPQMISGFNCVDEVWAATPFLESVLRRSSGGVPIVPFAHPVHLPQGDATEARARFPFDGRFTYLFAFDYNSCIKRKNPDGVCEAFVRAFPEPAADGPICVIKSINAALHPVQHALHKRRWAHRPDIILMDDFLGAQDRDLLIWRADAYVSLHRSEGLGLTLMESMAARKPCIATAYSGNLAFMTPENSWLIPSTSVLVGKGSLHYPAGQRWAEPDLSQAAAAMREIFDQPAEAARRAAMGAADIARNHDPISCGQHLKQLLAAAAAKTPRPKKIPEQSPRAAAFALLRRLRNMEKSEIEMPSAWWRLSETLEKIERHRKSTLRMQREIQSVVLHALKEQQVQHRSSFEELQRRVERLSMELGQMVSLLPPAPPPASPREANPPSSG